MLKQDLQLHFSTPHKTWIDVQHPLFRLSNSPIVILNKITLKLDGDYRDENRIS